MKNKKSCKEIYKELDKETDPVTRSVLKDILANRAVALEQELEECITANFYENFTFQTLKNQ